MLLLKHTAYESSRRLLKQALDQHRPGHMVFLIGPSGVGKTTMRRSVMQEMFGKPSLWGAGKTPVVETFATLPNRAYFSSKELAVSLLDEIHAPSLRWILNGDSLDNLTKEAIRKQIAEYSLIWSRLRPRRATEGEYWGMVQRGLVSRGCKYVSIDQVTALLVNHRDTSPADHTLHLMVIAEMTGTMFLMTGIHTAALMWHVHPELRRRVTTIWVRPYSDKRKEDYVPFLRLLKSVGRKYPLAHDDLLISIGHDVLSATGGIYAEVLQLLERAKALADHAGSIRITKKHLESCYYSDADLKALWSANESFEAVMVAGDVTERSKLAKARWGSLPDGEQA